MTVVIVTDSSARLPDALRRRYRIRQVPLHVLSGELDLREDVDEIGPEIYNNPQTTTSGVTPADLEAAYAQAVDESDGDGVVAVHLSRRFSGTWGSARVVAEKFQGHIRVVDSRTVGLGVGFSPWPRRSRPKPVPTWTACTRRRSGSGRPRNVCCVCSNWRICGRADASAPPPDCLPRRSADQARSCEWSTGRWRSRKSSGPHPRPSPRLIDSGVEIADQRPVTLGVQHCEAPDLAKQIIEALQSKLTITSLVQADFGPVLSRHVGTGAVGIAVTTSLDPIDLT